MVVLRDFPYSTLFGLFMTPCLAILVGEFGESFIFKFEEIGTVQMNKKLPRVFGCVEFLVQIFFPKNFWCHNFFVLAKLKLQKRPQKYPHLLSPSDLKFQNIHKQLRCRKLKV